MQHGCVCTHWKFNWKSKCALQVFSVSQSQKLKYTTKQIRVFNHEHSLIYLVPQWTGKNPMKMRMNFVSFIYHYNRYIDLNIRRYLCLSLLENFWENMHASRKVYLHAHRYTAIILTLYIVLCISLCLCTLECEYDIENRVDVTAVYWLCVCLCQLSFTIQ